MTPISEILAAQRAFFRGGATLPVAFRLRMLRALREKIKQMEPKILEALRTDLGKTAFEGYMCEVGMALSELSYMIKHVRRFARPRRARTPLAQFPSKSYQISSPYGTVLIMSPWNYPFLLTVGPLANAIAAGNTAVVKPSAYAPATSELIAALIADCFPAEYVTAVTGGRQENAALLEQKFDLIFFTGSTGVGKEVLRHAAEHLTPAVLELGGKSPCIIDSTAKLKLAAKRVVFGKFLNCGQTCVAPDYILCQRTVKDAFLKELKAQIEAQYGKVPLQNADYGRIVNEKHFDRICALIDPEKVVHGGDLKRDTLQISPTVLDGVTFDDAVMQEEIFGPVLPILTFDRMEEVISLLRGRPKPLALYLFTESKAHIEEITARLSFGGSCINDTVIHLATSEMGFGGVGESGMGAYHGKVGFDAFSHRKNIVRKSTRLDLPMRYRPHKKRGEKLLRFFLK